MNLLRTWAIMRKEGRHIMRDRRSFILVTISPVFLLMVMAYTFMVDIKNVAVAVMDRDRTPLSRRYIAGLGGTGDVLVRYVAGDYGQLEHWLMTSQAKAALVIPPGFEATLRSGREASIQLLVEGTEPVTANTAMAHVGGYTRQFALEVAGDAAARAGLDLEPAALSPIDLRMRTWYNPTLEMVIGFLPALVAMVMGMPGVTTTLALTREKEHGTLEQLIATPLRRSELLIGKLIPYVISGLFGVALCVLAAVYWFGSPFEGSLLLYLVLSVDFLLATLAIALVMSVFVKTQQAAQLGAMLVFFFPGFFLSGIFYPLVSMQPLMKMEAYMVPTTHYVNISRGIFLKGQGLEVLWPYALALLAMGLVFMTLAILLFRKKLA
ncbi:MAG: ABC transporter permease [Anaerolineae bacterium]|nr:ABC transporter permease [Anaerolineae bacterium]